MKRALLKIKIERIKTTIAFQHSIPHNSDFKSGKYDVGQAGQFLQCKPTG